MRTMVFGHVADSAVDPSLLAHLTLRQLESFVT